MPKLPLYLAIAHGLEMAHDPRAKQKVIQLIARNCVHFVYHAHSAKSFTLTTFYGGRTADITIEPTWGTFTVSLRMYEAMPQDQRDYLVQSLNDELNTEVED